MLPQAGDMISNYFDAVLEDFKSVESMLSSIIRIYNLVNVKNALVDGNLDASAAGFSDRGLSLTMRNVEFSYPGSKSKDGALRDISFSIAAGQVVVIVGNNGSGKSTLLKLLTRLYDCTSGEVLIDGKDIRNYKLADLQGATAVLTQDHLIYHPLSLLENIGIGNPDQASNEDLIQQSARNGLADTFISKFSDGYHTVLKPEAVHHWAHSFCTTDETPLAKIFKGFEQETQVSGGECQRVVASRTFMRLTSGKIKLMVADEPSSNLDPKAEQELFENLLKERQGKTMIFVTHRFGHLTQRADLILCMKDGRLVEQGTHTELIAARGEYCRLYDIQARPFKEESVTE
ncbi:P-loop containing nucleoside triphosphate hydrolase protein [Mycena epipterygia]|nr:P-loop containing nucleoside triphosphate hydrolase protein [Mycena epipterygia]